MTRPNGQRVAAAFLFGVAFGAVFRLTLDAIAVALGGLPAGMMP